MRRSVSAHVSLKHWQRIFYWLLRAYRIAGNFRWVLIFAISRTVYGVAKIKTAIIYSNRNVFCQIKYRFTGYSNVSSLSAIIAGSLKGTIFFIHGWEVCILTWILYFCKISLLVFVYCPAQLAKIVLVSGFQSLCCVWYIVGSVYNIIKYFNYN